MGKRIILLLTILLSLSFFSCSSFRVIDVETHNPSLVTFPKEVQTVMIINNSAQQSDNVGHSYIDANGVLSNKSISMDSMAYFLCMSLGKTIVQSPRFDDVRICEDTIRRDSFFYDIRPIKPADVELYCRDYNVDALISLDKLLITTTDVDAGNVINRFVKVEISGVVRALWVGQKEMYTIPFEDSLAWYMKDDFLYGGTLEVLSEPDVKVAMRYASEYIGNSLDISFVPHWTNVKRWYYKNILSDWKRGTVYADAEKWDEARNIWLTLYEKSVKWKHKAQLSSNIALCYEMDGDFDKAIEYAEISYNLYKENAENENDSHTDLQNYYFEALKKRKTDDVKLSEQLGEEINE